MTIETPEQAYMREVRGRFLKDFRDSPSPMNEREACKHGMVGVVPRRAHTLSKTGVAEVQPVASSCAFLHADGNPDFQCSFRPAEGSQYCQFHRLAVAGEITRAKAKAYDNILKGLDSRMLQFEDVPVAGLRQVMALSLRNAPDTRTE